MGKHAGGAMKSKLSEKLTLNIETSRIVVVTLKQSEMIRAGLGEKTKTCFI